MYSCICSVSVDGWWTFELCLFTKVRQFHQEGKVISAESSLGLFSANAARLLGPAVSGNDTDDNPYHSQLLSGGTVCDITGQERSTEIRFFCSKDGANFIGPVVEPSTCSYVMSFYTPLLCVHRSFKIKKVSEVDIFCWPAAETTDSSILERVDKPVDMHAPLVGSGESDSVSSDAGADDSAHDAMIRPLQSHNGKIL